MKTTNKLAMLTATLTTVGALSVAEPTTAAVINPLKSRLKAATSIWKIALAIGKVRSKCARDVERGVLDWQTVDCTEYPIAMGGNGTGNVKTDEKMLKAYGKVDRGFLRLQTQGGDPVAHGLDEVCSPATNTWANMYACALQLGVDAADTLGTLHFNPDFSSRSVPVETSELACRSTIGSRTRGTYRKLLKSRAKCFQKSGLLATQEFTQLYQCRAPALPPGLGTPQSGLESLDRRESKLRTNFAAGLFQRCPSYLGDKAFPWGATITDPSDPAVFGIADLVQVELEQLIQLSGTVLDRLYAGVPYCGDGNVDDGEPGEKDLGEECDDGNLVNCDGCDINCTASSRTDNGVACYNGTTYLEECDDADADAEDGCNAGTLEYCGDGTLQVGLLEDCDDGNFVDADVCSNECIVN